MNYTSIEAPDRRLVIFASEAKIKELSAGIDWSQVATATLPLTSAAHLNWLFPLCPVLNTASRAYGLYRLLSHLRAPKRLPYPVFDVIIARPQFRFPVNHPVDGGVYACCDAEPNLYVPLTAFHRYMYEAKMSAFHIICADLGVKTCSVIYAEEDGRDISSSVGVSGVPTQAGPASVRAEGGHKTSSGEKAAIHAEYPRPESPLRKSDSRWMNGEPTWEAMQKLRLERAVEHFKVEFDYSSDMGITADVAAKVNKIGLNIGGKYEEMKRRKWVFDIKFWPITPTTA